MALTSKYSAASWVTAWSDFIHFSAIFVAFTSLLLLVHHLLLFILMCNTSWFGRRVTSKILQLLSLISLFTTTGIDTRGLSLWRKHSTSRSSISGFRRRNCSHSSWWSLCNRHVPLQQFFSMRVVAEYELYGWKLHEISLIPTTSHTLYNMQHSNSLCLNNEMITPNVPPFS